MAHHIHRQRHNINVSGALSVSEQRSLNTVSACEQCKLGVGNTCSAVVVRMEAYCDMLAVFEILLIYSTWLA